jgi:acyl-CoA reductase-like NAD-dependent aldehyde dehydrogenase
MHSLSLSQFLAELGLSGTNAGCFDGTSWGGAGTPLDSVAPSTGDLVAVVQQALPDDVDRCLAAMNGARKAWASTPAPARGEVVRQIGNAVR